MAAPMVGDRQAVLQTERPAVEAAVRVEGVTHWFAAPDSSGDEICVLDDVSFDVPPGQFVSIVGTSGCGKTTVLNMMAGLLKPTDGVVSRGGRPATSPGREIGYMVANSGLLPWRHAVKNVELGLEYRGVRKRERRDVAVELLRRVGLDGFADAYPSELSQGMKQRVALARTLAVDPAFLFMDEPFAALDAQTKLLIQAEFTKLWEGNAKTVVFVTHDLEEAVALSDRVIVFSARPGRIKADIPIDLPRPRDFVELRFEPRFKELTEQVWTSLREEVLGRDD